MEAVFSPSCRVCSGIGMQVKLQVKFNIYIKCEDIYQYILKQDHLLQDTRSQLKYSKGTVRRLAVNKEIYGCFTNLFVPTSIIKLVTLAASEIMLSSYTGGVRHNLKIHSSLIRKNKYHVFIANLLHNFACK